MEKKYKEMTASAKLSPQIFLGELIRRAQAQRSHAAPNSWIRIKKNELKN